VILIGVGNPFRKDDGAGPAVAALVRAKSVPGVRILVRTGEGADLIECWGPGDDVIIVDAMRSGGEAGTILRIDAKEGAFPVEHFKVSSHSFGVAEAVEVARALERLPRSLVVYGIEAAETGDGEGLSGNVDRAVEDCAGRILGEISRGGSA